MWCPFTSDAIGRWRFDGAPPPAACENRRIEARSNVHLPPMWELAA
jgi:hypothetical protein